MMDIRWVGAILIVGSCGWTGFQMAAQHRRETGLLRQLICLLDHMECELQYRHTPLPELCCSGAEKATGLLKRCFGELAAELEKGNAMDADGCMRTVLARQERMPSSLKEMLKQFGSNMGAFDLEGQIKGIRLVKQECDSQLKSRRQNQEERIRSYQTLGICAGAGIAILFI